MYYASQTHIIHPESNIADSDVEVKHFQWDWNLTQLFPNFNTKAFNSIMKSLRESIPLKNIGKAQCNEAMASCIIYTYPPPLILLWGSEKIVIDRKYNNLHSGQLPLLSCSRYGPGKAILL